MKTEVPFSSPLTRIDGKTQTEILSHNGTPYAVNGLIDCIDNDTIIDYKLTADPATYFADAAINPQLMTYAAALAWNAHRGDKEAIRAKRVLLRVVARPSIKFKAKQTIHDYINECWSWLSSRIDKSEGLHEFELPVTKNSLRAAWANAGTIAEEMTHARNVGAYPRNTGHCYKWNRPCKFLALCVAEGSGNDPKPIIDSAFKARPERVGGAPKPEGYTTISHSQMTTFTACRALWRWEYVERLAPVTAEESEALETGSGFHKGMEAASMNEAWWNTFDAAMKGFGDTRERLQRFARAWVATQLARREWVKIEEDESRVIEDLWAICTVAGEIMKADPVEILNTHAGVKRIDVFTKVQDNPDRWMKARQVAFSAVEKIQTSILDKFQAIMEAEEVKPAATATEQPTNEEAGK